MKAALITPAYSRDGQLLDLACEQLDRFAPAGLEHIIVASRKNRSQFRHLQAPHRTLLLIEDVLPHIWRTPVNYRRRELYFYKGFRPIDGWIIQQIVKLAAPDYSQADLFVYLDSDVFLIRPFCQSHFVEKGRVRLLRKPPVDTLDHRDWARTTELLFDLPPPPSPAADYIGSFVSWRRDVCIALRERLEAQWRRPWLEIMMHQKRFSEYMLYGTYVDRLLSGCPEKHFATDRELCLSSWDLRHDANLAAEFRRAILPHHVAINIQSNLRLPFTVMRQTLSDVLSALPDAEENAHFPP